jgi:hypothetical protein
MQLRPGSQDPEHLCGAGGADGLIVAEGRRGPNGCPSNDGMIEPLRERQFPIVGDAAATSVLALRHEGPAIYNIVDDEPAPVREWLPLLANAFGAEPPSATRP